MARLLVVWCPDWPAVAASLAAGVTLDVPAAVVRANRVLACTGTARRHGVRRGMRRREAQSVCPELVVAASDPDQDARMFEPVAAEVERTAPGIELVRPGMVAVPVQGPGRAFGGEARAAERLVDHIAGTHGLECVAGVADGLFAAAIAAMHGKIVPSGSAAEFLAPLPIGTLTTPVQPVQPSLERTRAQLVDLLVRVGVRNVGAFAALPERDVNARFGTDAVRLHRLARGRQERPAVRRAVAPELLVRREFDPPLERLDVIAFAASELAGRFHTTLAERGLSCVRLAVHAKTVHGETFARTWRCAEPLTEHGIAERVRWQLEGWLRRHETAPTAGIDSILLEPAETVSGAEGQLRLGEETGERDSARALNRVQGLLGPDQVFTPVLRGGRTPGERVRLVPWGEPRVPDTDPALPWPGKLPAPSPATVPVQRLAVAVLDAERNHVGISARHVLTAAPHALVLDGGAPKRVRDWAGPWLFNLRWWTETPPGGLARVQLLCGGEEETERQGFLLVRRDRCWFLEGVYD